MNLGIKDLLSQVYELEGLLLVLERRQGDAPEHIYEMVQNKVARILEIAPSIVPPTQINAPLIKQTDVPQEEEPTIDAVEPEEDLPQDVSPSLDMLGPEQEENDDCEVEDDVEEIDDIIDTDDIEDIDEDDGSVDIADSDDIEDIDEDDGSVDIADSDDIEDIDDTDGVIEPDDSDFIEPITLDEALQRSLSKDLSKAFSLNDRFRYRRELFSNSEIEMRNTLNLVEAMQSFAEAEDYFYGDLEWDKESPEVMDFMTIIRNHFL